MSKLLRLSYLFCLLIPAVAFSQNPQLVATTSSRDLPLYQDLSQSPPDRARDLVARMTLSEKVGQLLHAAPAIPRLGVPAYNYWNEALHGVARAGHATVFPQAIGLAATWDPELLFRVSDVISTEARAKYHEALRQGKHEQYYGLTFWSPNINLFRDPRWGRGQETYGEDPFLTGKMAVAFIRGLQGQDSKYLKAVATPKHFAVHSGLEPERHTFDARPPERDFYESYLPHFEAAIREGGAWSIMGAYNRVYGVPACSSELLLDEILRNKWGFAGYVVSDCWALSDIFLRHKALPNKEETAAAALRAGCDLECGNEVYGSLISAINNGLVQESSIDISLQRVFETRFRLGMFDPPAMVPYANIPTTSNGAPAHGVLALKVALKSLVLLKNDGILPLDRRTVQRIAVVGPNGDSLTALIGNYAGHLKKALTVYEALREQLGARVDVIYIRGIEHAASSAPFVPIPDLCLEYKGEPGLLGTYFANSTLSGKPSISRQDHSLNFRYDLEDGAAPIGIPRTGNSARWSGEIVAPADGAYTLAVRSNNGVRLWLSGRQVINQWNEKERPDQTARLELKTGQRVSVRLEFFYGESKSANLVLLWNRKDLDLTANLLAHVKNSDVVIFVGGLTGELEGEEGAGENLLEGLQGGDRVSIEMPRIQTELMRALFDAGKKVILVNMTGSATAMPWEAKHLPAILQAWYPGQAGGTAIANVLFGETNPAGRLPVTFYRSTSDLPDFADYSMRNRTYRFYAGKPLYPFGHGLSYTKFEYSHIELDLKSVPKDGVIKVSADIRNTGARDGEEVVQVYVRQVDAPVPKAIHDLRAFRSVSVAKGKSVRVQLEFPAASLRRWDETQKQYCVDPGEYELQVGASAEDIRQKLSFHIQN